MDLATVIASIRRRVTPESIVAEFAARSGATDLARITDLVEYIKNQGLWDSTAIYPMKSAQNAGSGATVYGLGGLGADDMTLVGSPTWGASGLVFNGTTQAGRIPDFLGSDSLTVFARANIDATAHSGIQVLWSQWDTGANLRSLYLYRNGNTSGDPLFCGRDAVGSSPTGFPGGEYYNIGTQGTGSDRCHVFQAVDGGGLFAWDNKTARTLTLIGGGFVAQTEKFDSSVDVTIGASLNNNALDRFMPMTATTLLHVEAPLTTTQREAITDFVNAL